MKKLFTSIAIFFVALISQAQINFTKAKANTGRHLSIIDSSLGTNYTMATTALNVVNGQTFEMGDCIVLGDYRDPSYVKDCKTMEDEFTKMLKGSTWTFDKYDANGQSLVKVKTTAGQTEQSTYSGFTGDATVRIDGLISGVTIQAYYYECKNSSNKYVMIFAIANKAMYVEMSKKGKSTESVKVQTAAATTDKPTASSTTATAPTTIKDTQKKTTDSVKNKAKKLLKGKKGS